MVKKRVRDAEVLPEAPPIEDSGDEDMDMVDVDFEFFNYKPDVDFHGLKALLRQLLDVDAQLFNLSELSDLVLSQPTIGSTVKVDGEDTDAYAIMTILNLYEHREKPIIRDLTRYLTEKAKSSQTLALVADLLSSSKHVGLVLAERMINVPAELSPPMYTMLIDEIEAAVEDKEPYEFTHYLIVSKTYREVASTLDQEDAPKLKKNKSTNGNKETFYFHPEDEVLQNHALAYGAYEYTKDAGEGMADSKRAFSDMGIKTQGSMILIEASKFQGAAEAIGKYISPQ